MSDATNPISNALFADAQHPHRPKLRIEGKPYDRRTFEPEEANRRCIDCDALPGELHELGCDAEDCPACGEQLIGCGHLPADEDE